MEKLNFKQHLFFSLFSDGFFGKRLRKDRSTTKGRRSANPEKHKEKSVKKNCVAVDELFHAYVATIYKNRGCLLFRQPLLL